MKIVRRSIDPHDGTGFATLLPQEPEDMWHAFNLIQPNDVLRAAALRKVSTESGAGSVTTRRVHTTLSIRVRSTDFDAAAQQLHVSGRVAEANEVAPLGSFHTLDLELQRNFTLEKAGGWDSVALEVLEQAADQRRGAHVWAVVMNEGLANVCLITEHQTIFKQRVETNVPRKRAGGSESRDKAVDKFFATLLSNLLRHMDLPSQDPNVKTPLLLASPGFTAASFLAYIKEQAVKTGDKQLMSFVPSILTAHSSSAHMHSLGEVLSSPALKSKLADTKYSRESALMDRFFDLLRRDDARAWYGPREVERAVAQGAVGRGGGVLLISNLLFRASEVGERKRWVSLVDKVRQEHGGEVRVLSSLHESGKRLEGLGNVAAILTYPIEGLDEDGNEDEGGEQEVDGGGNKNLDDI